jgi:glutamate synthase domain-containing protein 3
MKEITIDAGNEHYRTLNEKINEIAEQNSHIIINNVCGQRYIGAGMKKDIRLVINGTPGNDLGAFMDGPEIIVNGNAQDAVGNTMNSGSIIINGNAGDIIGYGMRGGKIYIKNDVGYRVGIHMKAYKDNFPVIVIGGCARDFLGEYIAGGLLIILGLNDDVPVGDFVGVGMHGGIIYVRGKINEYQIGKEVGIDISKEDDLNIIEKYIEEFCVYFKIDKKKIFNKPFFKLYPKYLRPYGKLYAY